VQRRSAYSWSVNWANFVTYIRNYTEFRTTRSDTRFLRNDSWARRLYNKGQRSLCSVRCQQRPADVTSSSSLSSSSSAVMLSLENRPPAAGCWGRLRRPSPAYARSLWHRGGVSTLLDCDVKGRLLFDDQRLFSSENNLVVLVFIFFSEQTLYIFAQFQFFNNNNSNLDLIPGWWFQFLYYIVSLYTQTCYAIWLSISSGYCEFNALFYVCRVELSLRFFFFICRILACSCVVCLC